MSRSSIILVLGGLIFILLVNSIFIVNEKEKALVTQFGEVIRPDVPVGLHLKLPIIQNVEKFDARLQSLDEEPDRIPYTNKFLTEGLIDSIHCIEGGSALHFVDELVKHNVSFHKSKNSYNVSIKDNQILTKAYSSISI